jgi:hypothetical protein
MKPRHKWLNDILMSRKPGRHEDKRTKAEKKQASEEMRAIKSYKRRKQELSLFEDDNDV